MASKFFYVHNGLTVGNLAVDATTGDLSTNGQISSTSTVNATSTSTGALQIAGGAGVSMDLWVGGNINSYGTTNLAGIQVGPATEFPIALSGDGSNTLYDSITTSTVIFADGTVQSSRAPISWTNDLFLSVANYYNIDPGTAFQSTLQGGLVKTGDTYFDNGSFGGPPNHIYMMLDQGNGLVQFFDITPVTAG
jgi:hypothetical protein